MGGLHRRNHVFEKIFELSADFERRIVGERRRVRISRRVRRSAGGSDQSDFGLWEVRGEGKYRRMLRRGRLRVLCRPGDDMILPVP